MILNEPCKVAEADTMDANPTKHNKRESMSRKKEKECNGLQWLIDTKNKKEQYNLLYIPKAYCPMSHQTGSLRVQGNLYIN